MKKLKYGMVFLAIVGIGVETAGTFISLRDTITGKMNRQSLIRWEPHISYYPFKNCGFGITSKIEHFQSNFLADQSTLFEIGLMARAFVPLVVNNSIFKNLSLSFVLSLSKANYYYYEKSQYVVYDMTMSQNVLRIPVILSYNLWKNINLRYSFRYLNFFGQYARFESSIGFEYHFLKKK